MKIFKTQLALTDVPGQTFLFDTVMYEGEWWLVRDWIDSQDGKWTKPMRIVALATLPGGEVNHPDFRFFLQSPIPSTVFDGQIPPATEGVYRVIEQPELILPRHLN